MLFQTGAGRCSFWLLGKTYFFNFMETYLTFLSAESKMVFGIVYIAVVWAAVCFMITGSCRVFCEEYALWRCFCIFPAEK